MSDLAQSTVSSVAPAEVTQTTVDATFSQPASAAIAEPDEVSKRELL